MSGQCPSCHAPVDFRPGAGKVKVCEHCNTVVLRGEAKLENLGKVAELADTESPLKLGLSGRSSGSPFTVVGRLQKQNATGTWDEWCLAFDDGRTGWLSESEGEWNLMFPLEGVALPAADALQPLLGFTVRDKPFVVEEVGEASTRSAEGQLPDFNAQHVYADATGPKGVFASLDYGGGGAEAFVGSRVTLVQLGFSKSDLEPTPRHDALSGARCPQCNGPLALKAPDAAKRVACPYCGALLDVAHGQLAFLQLLEKPPYEPPIPLGAEGLLAGTRWTVLAFLIRSCTVEGVRYPWEEYLLWSREKGFSWLMQSNGHWTTLQPIPAGEVQRTFKSARYQGRSYRAYQSVSATTDYVLGECYWTVSVGEQAQATEYVDPPYSLNVDLTRQEVTFTFGTLVPKDTVEQAFKPRVKLGEPTGVASAQVNPFREKAASAWRWSAVWAGLLLTLTVIFSAMSTTATYYSGRFTVPPGAGPGSAEAQGFSEPFSIPRRVPLEVTVRAPGLDNNWLGVSVDLVSQESSAVVAVYGESSFYSGVEDGERWTEGSRDSSKQTREVDPGSYVLRVTPSFEANRASDYSVEVKADDGPGFACPVVMFLLIFLAPVYYQLRASSFETQRWSDSVFQSAS